MTFISTSTPPTASNKGGATSTSTSTTTLDALPPDLLQSHILSRLDGLTLIYTSCLSSQFREFCMEESLWRDICFSTWPSTDNPRVRQLISISPTTPFFLLLYTLSLFSADDLRRYIHYKDELIFSKVQETEIQSKWLCSSLFRVDLLDIKDVVPTPIRASGEDMCQDIANGGLTLSWIVIDPMGRRAANLSSWRAVSMHRHWLSWDIQVRIVTILAVDRGFVQFVMVVTYGACEGGEMIQVRETYLHVEDMEGMNLNGKETRNSREGKRRKKKRDDGKQRYKEYLKLKRERKERRLRRERRLDTICVVFGFSIIAAN
ncbi:hypothetical protein NE237_005187 [Protea cynaroides]|uniref:F-box domain-containing protein n=1 Tax=Protea cynaroides TaxID=273540 RepID=A0A9Q0QU78_9MAGN|nr:hypothetical protein NE237_005187 [Protea cynaroides]